MRIGAGVIAVACLAALGTGCGDSGVAAVPGRSQPATRPGVSQDVALVSEVDGAPIAFTVHEPEAFAEGQRYPLVVTTHGFAQTRANAAGRATMPAPLQPLVAAGYGIISIDMRGHGDSGGLAHAADPDFEGRDLLQVLDWAEANLTWLQYRDGNLVLGGYGASYGGGMMHLLHAIDPAHRLDSLAIGISWHDLRYSFFDGEVFKSLWARNLAAAAAQAGTRLHPELAAMLATGTAGDTLTPAQLEFLYRSSPIAYCEAGTLAPIDALYLQSTIDTLFDLNEGVANARCYRQLGGDVRLWGIPKGHGGGEHERCGERDSAQAIVAWFDEKLRGRRNAARAVPDLCLNLGYTGSDAVVPDDYTVGGAGPFELPPQSVVLFGADDRVIDVPLVTIGADGDVFAGTATAEITMLDPQLGELGAGDPIVYVGIGVQRAGGPTEVVNNIRPFRGYGTRSARLNGGTERLQPGDVLVLRLRTGMSGVYEASASRAPTPVTISGRVRLPLLGPLRGSPG